ncbi:MAG: hypothetical protein KKG47_05660 [Proteobacteria bacterium]|nr:hypothetical protein [Pseudomonadota bacterium]MBU1736963.1 hypothetical protein [Pseudomonadota bacterium]
MSEKQRLKPASKQEISLYCLVGESVCAVQHVEDALSHSIVLKKTKPQLRSEADQLLEKHRSYTLGKAIKIAEQASLYPESLQRELENLLSERNWLIHKSIAQGRDEWDLNISREKLLSRIKAITTKKGVASALGFCCKGVGDWSSSLFTFSFEKLIISTCYVR